MDIQTLIAIDVIVDVLTLLLVAVGRFR